MKETCDDCGSELVFNKTPNSVHYGRLDCPNCDRWIKWVSNPDKDERKKSSSYGLKEIADFYGFDEVRCFFCRRKEEELGKNETLTLDHIKELQNGGEDRAKNLQILCTACHKLKNWNRLYHNWHFNDKGD